MNPAHYGNSFVVNPTEDTREESAGDSPQPSSSTRNQENIISLEKFFKLVQRQKAMKGMILVCDSPPSSPKVLDMITRLKEKTPFDVYYHEYSREQGRNECGFIAVFIAWALAFKLVNEKFPNYGDMEFQKVRGKIIELFNDFVEGKQEDQAQCLSGNHIMKIFQSGQFLDNNFYLWNVDAMTELYHALKQISILTKLSRAATDWNTNVPELDKSVPEGDDFRNSGILDLRISEWVSKKLQSRALSVLLSKVIGKIRPENEELKSYFDEITRMLRCETPQWKSIDEMMEKILTVLQYNQTTPPWLHGIFGAGDLEGALNKLAENHSEKFKIAIANIKYLEEQETKEDGHWYTVLVVLGNGTTA
uniref:uncharacterized protein LOC120342872 n=1 Tax=Styela clava TaxID=7725 RepID=UPI00193A50AF|nr:uncharacterized protein LOC120342872 [Styela clava]